MAGNSPLFEEYELIFRLSADNRRVPESVSAKEIDPLCSGGPALPKRVAGSSGDFRLQMVSCNTRQGATTRRSAWGTLRYGDEEPFTGWLQQNPQRCRSPFNVRRDWDELVDSPVEG